MFNGGENIGSRTSVIDGMYMRGTYSKQDWNAWKRFWVFFYKSCKILTDILGTNQ